MTIRHIRVFLKVYEIGNITEAARQLYLSQPAVSRIIQEIEGHFGVKLFERISQRLYATPAAAGFYQRAKHVVDTFDDLDTSLKNWDETGILRVGASITLGNFLMPQIAAMMKKQRPGLDLRVQVAQGETLHRMLLDNTLDVAMIENYVADEYLHCIPFVSDRLVPVLAPDHPLVMKKSVSLADLAAIPLLMRERGSAGREFVTSVFAARDLHPSILWESESTQALVRATAAGLGAAILPEMLVRGDLKEGTVSTVEISDERFERMHYIVHHRNKFLSASMKEFMELCEYFASR